jgi:hypothetical protein
MLHNPGGVSTFKSFVRRYLPNSIVGRSLRVSSQFSHIRKRFQDHMDALQAPYSNNKRIPAYAKPYIDPAIMERVALYNQPFHGPMFRRIPSPTSHTAIHKPLKISIISPDEMEPRSRRSSHHKDSNHSKSMNNRTTSSVNKSIAKLRSRGDLKPVSTPKPQHEEKRLKGHDSRNLAINFEFEAFPRWLGRMLYVNTSRPGVVNLSMSTH